MVTHYLTELVATSKNVLLLQGPIGGFFLQFSKWLQVQQKSVYKINFNGGDEYDFPPSAQVFAYRDTPEQFEAFLQSFCVQHQIDSVVCFGDNRYYHRVAKKLSVSLDLSFWVFEEGYLRPNFVTLEKTGVNAYSELPREKAFFEALPELNVKKPVFAPMHKAESWLRTAIKAMRYYFEVNYHQRDYPHYQHHRELAIGYYIKTWINILSRRIFNVFSVYVFENRVKRGELGEFFVLPLQVHNDSQVKVHCDYESVEAFLQDVLHSFAENAPKQTCLIIKPHPMDEQRDYRKLIAEFKVRYPDLENRLFYVYRVSMPVLYRKAKGLITINSTCGFSALLHEIPVKILGRAHYDIDGLIDKQPLAQFWQNPISPDKALFERFRRFHLNKTQINGSFYHQVDLPNK